MTVREELVEMRKRLSSLYDDREREAVILLIFDYVKGWHRVDLIINEGKELSEFSRKEMDLSLIHISEPTRH